MHEDGKMERTIGVAGAVATLVGFVIGISVFLLPGELAGVAGPAVILSYGLASIMAMFSCFVGAQVGVIFPVSGASFVSMARLISPFFGFMALWLTLCAVAIAVALVGYGFADYFELLVPGLDRTSVAVAVILFFAGLNLMGAEMTVGGQGVLVALFMTVLVVLCGAGIGKVDWNLLRPFVPNGYSSVFNAAIPAFFSYAGFLMIIELGGEVTRPSRTIPRALLISFVVVLLTYSSVSLIVVGTVPWQQLGGMSAPVGEVAARILPPWTANIITLTILAAAGTSINAILFGYSRDVLAMARAGLFPSEMARISEKRGAPVYGVIVLTVLSLIAVLFSASITEYATVIVLSIMAVQILLGWVALRIPRRLESRYRNAEFKLGRFGLPFFSIGMMLFSALFIYIGMTASPGAGMFAGVILFIGVVYYQLRRRFLASRSISVEALVAEEVSRMDGGHE